MCVCLHNDHQTHECRSPGCQKCGNRHHTPLCFSGSSSQQQQSSYARYQRGRFRFGNNSANSANFTPLIPQRAPPSAAPSATLVTNATTTVTAEPTRTQNEASATFKVSTLTPTSILGTLPVTLRNQQHVKIAYAIIDPGSEKSFISEKLANELKLVTEQLETLQLQVCASENSVSHISRKVKAQLETTDGSHYIFHANTLEFLTQPLQHLSAYSSENLPLCVQPEVLIGVDHAMQLIIWQRLERLPTRFQLLQTKLGPAIMGSGILPHNQRSTATSLHVQASSNADNTRQHLAELWTLDNIGITDDPLINDDDYAIAKF